MGIDEAGRGPVLGPMVYATCFGPISRKDEIERLGFADSKQLTEKQRDVLFDCICSSSELLGWKAEILSPNDISNGMLQRTKYSLNALSHDTAKKLIRRVLDDGVLLSEVYVDTVGDPAKYQALLQDTFPHVKITVSKKADSLFPIVSAASICAKVLRDTTLKEWQFIEKDIEISSDFGSGYPGDPATKRWLQESLDQLFGYPSIVRFSWATCAIILDNKAYAVKWPDDDESQSTPAGCAKISQYFQPSTADESRKRHRFFEERGLCITSDF